jgi:hypothetical protein
MIEKFDDLLEQANQQTDAQRLLFLFAASDVVKKAKKRDEKKGSLSPVMCVDKLPAEVDSFKALAGEADGISQDWDMVLIAALSGEGATAPTTEEAEPFLNKMANDLSSGQDLSRYVIFDREENPIVIQTA